MQVTFMIGNGFDLKLGLETQFKQFFPHYLELPAPEDKYVRRFKQLLQQDGKPYPHWADFERALGRHTGTPPMDCAQGILACIRDFERCFAQYLKEQQDRIAPSTYPKASEKFYESLAGYLSLLPTKPARTVREALPVEDATVFNILNFNYTTVIDHLLVYSPSIHLPPGDSIGKHIHVHGTFRVGMILGVDNIGQIANPGVFSSEDEQRMLLKPLMNQQFDEENDFLAKECIQNSDIICIFGMSIGETDRTWWQEVGYWLSEAPYRQLIIFSRGGGLAPLNPYDTYTHQKNLRERFLRETCRPTADLSNQVHVVITDEPFKLPLTLASSPLVPA